MVRTFKAHEKGSITHMKQVDGTSLLVTIAEDLSNEPVLKVWALDKTEKKGGGPKCLSTVSVQNGRKQFPVSIDNQVDFWRENPYGIRFRLLLHWKIFHSWPLASQMDP